MQNFSKWITINIGTNMLHGKDSILFVNILLLQHTVYLNICIMIYFAYFHSMLKYGIQVWKTPYKL